MFYKYFVDVEPFHRLFYSSIVSLPIISYYPIKSYLYDQSNTVKPTGKLLKLIEETAKEQNIKLYKFDALVNDEAVFKLFPNWLSRPTLVIPKYLTFDRGLDDLSSSYVNSLLKREYGVELNDQEKWYSEEGKKIISSFLLTDQAKKFLLARNMHRVQCESIFSYHCISTMLIYVTTQIFKWMRDYSIKFAEDLKEIKKQNSHSATKSNKVLWRLFFLRNRRLLFVTFASTYFAMSVGFYFAVGIKDDRDADALALSRGLAHAMKIKQKTSYIDFGYYSGAEEAYRKECERNTSLNKLFFDGLSDYERLMKQIPIDQDGNKFTIFGNFSPIHVSLETINAWERKSG